MGRRKKQDRVPVESQTAGGMGTLGDLLRSRGLETREGLSEASDGPDGGAAPPEAVKPPPASPGRVVLQTERKGRGGRTVTMLRGVHPDVVDALAVELRRALGCGASVEDGAIVLQGDQRGAAGAILAHRGHRVVKG